MGISDPNNALLRRGPTAAVCCIAAVLTAGRAAAQQITLPQGSVLHVELDRRVRIHPGAKLTGHLTAPLYLVDHEVVPSGSLVTGTITGTHKGSRKEHVRRLLAADFTPPRLPNVTFDTLMLPASAGRPAASVAIQAPAERTEAAVLTLGTKAKKRSLKQQISDQIVQTKDMATGALHQHNYREIVEKWAVGQLPYHPEILWSKTNFNADLAQPVTIGDKPHTTLPTQDLKGRLPDGVLQARLTTPLTSETARRGDLVEAIVTEPLFSPDKQTMLVPEGTHMFGKVMQVKPARRWGHNGVLRFSFSKLDLPNTGAESKPLEIHGHLSAAETAPGEHISMDEEGEVKASGGPEKLVEPALLTVLASGAGQEDHGDGTALPGAAAYSSNGFGLIARVVSLTTRDTNVIQGFAYYSLAKSVYYRFIDKGHETTFPRDTRVQVTLSAR